MLTTQCKNWLATKAGNNYCFVSNGVNYTDPDGIARTGSTGDVVNAFAVAHLIGLDDKIIIANTNYSQLKVINGNNDVGISDVKWVYDNDGFNSSGTSEPQYCITCTDPTITLSIT